MYGVTLEKCLPGKYASCYVGGVDACPFFKLVTTTYLHVARLRVVAVALAARGLITRRKCERNGWCCGAVKECLTFIAT